MNTTLSSTNVEDTEKSGAEDAGGEVAADEDAHKGGAGDAEPLQDI